MRVPDGRAAEPTITVMAPTSRCRIVTITLRPDAFVLRIARAGRPCEVPRGRPDLVPRIWKAGTGSPP